MTNHHQGAGDGEFVSGHPLDRRPYGLGRRADAPGVAGAEVVHREELIEDRGHAVTLPFWTLPSRMLVYAAVQKCFLPGGPMPRTARLTRDDWAAAALDALAEGGPPAVAVEPVAARLGASKSSFYWLFDNRQALLAAALERWERVQTDEILPGWPLCPRPNASAAWSTTPSRTPPAGATWPCAC